MGIQNTSKATPRLKESAIERKLCEDMGRLGWSSIKLVDAPGWPDRMFYKDWPKMFFVECKTPSGKLSILQESRIDVLRAFGYRVVVYRGDNFAEIRETAKYLDAAQVPGEGVVPFGGAEVGKPVLRPGDGENECDTVRPKGLAKGEKNKANSPPRPIKRCV